jgi:phosphohistidine phosphatase
MKTLYLVRHAKSSWDNPALADFDRPLNKRGQRDAPNMAKRLKEKKVLPDRLLSSPANRALTTCKTFAKILGYDENKIVTNESLYHAWEDSILKVVKSTPAFVNTLFVFGHNPGFTDFANGLMNERINNIPTTGVVGCKLSIQKWEEIEWGQGKMFLFDFPKNKH